MRAVLRRSEPDGELSKPILTALAILSLGLATTCYFIVQAALPPTSALARWALVLLHLGAMSGFLQIFSVFFRIWQGGNVLPGPPAPKDN